MSEIPPPPADLLEVPGEPPSPERIWIKGYWHWNGEAYVWVAGHWATRPTK